MHHRSAVFALVLTAVLWSLGGVLVKYIDWSPLGIAGGRSAVAAVVTLAWLRRPSFTWDRTQWLAAFSYAATVILFVSATKLTTAANAIVIQYMAPLWVALVSWPLLREKVTRLDWVCIIFALGGMALFFFDKLEADSLLGLILAVASGIAFAATGITLKMQQGRSTTESIVLGNIITAVIALPFAFSGPLPNADGAIALVVMGVVQLAVPYIIYSRAVGHVSALEAVLIPVVEPLLNPVWVAIMIGEVPTPIALVGAVIVLASVSLRSVLLAIRR